MANQDFGNFKHLQKPGHLSLTAPSTGIPKITKPLKCDIEREKDKYFIKYMSEGLIHVKWFLVQVDMYQSKHIYVRGCGVYHCPW